jgi:diguanylate cyclase (GGDEF)-like protein
MAISLVVLVRLFLSAVACVIFLMAMVAWRRRAHSHEAHILALLMLSVSAYCFGSAQELAQTSLPQAMFWLHVEYLGIPWIPALWIILAHRHAGRRSPILLLLIIPVLTLVGQWTNLYNLYDTSITFVLHDPFWIVTVQRGPIALLNLAYLFGALFYGNTVYFWKYRTLPALLRWQAILMGIASTFPLLAYLVYLCGWSPWGLDIAPLVISMSGFVSYYVVFRLELFDLMPMARTMVFKNMRDAVLVTNLHYRLVDFNTAAGTLLPMLDATRLGTDVDRVFAQIPAIGKAFRAQGTSKDVSIQVHHEERHFDVSVFALMQDRYQYGWAMILADITDQVHMVENLQIQAETDPLTGVANRRALVAAMEKDLRALDEPFSLLLIDIDHFKQINDRLGHRAGDLVLHAVAAQIGRGLRTKDLLCRYGGDEFAVFLPGIELAQALDVAERIRRATEHAQIEFNGEILRVTISVGVAEHLPNSDEHWQQMLERADQELYSAKTHGRNCIEPVGKPAALRLG